ncbi:pirin family protein [Paenibacillus protaetiae]|uniref:Pirin family protein n=1 Tax=Paenibacillus protaetiae TaxID=2509456 RepID=A0A4P6F3D1_9BACL|nr:pirin family protein [Paenibacillus protaetiae]QAY67647.1 pirin family protein [Paenibacillus protaetiae]
MIQVTPANARYFVQNSWLQSYPSFSFGEYFDPNNTGFGVMRVCNDDTIAPSKGFGAHPHSDMEIVTLVLRGQIKHEDNLGNVAVSSAGELQRMTAGTGIIHAEYNPSAEADGRFLQLWFMPQEKGLEPSYETVSPSRSAMKNALLPVVTPDGREGTARIHQDVTIYLGELGKGHKSYFKQESGRRVFLFMIDGSLRANDKTLSPGDTARMEFEPDVLLSNPDSEQAYFMLIDLP